MTTNINFSFARLMAVTKRDLMENWKTNLYRILGCYSALFIGLIFLLMVNELMVNEDSNEKAYNIYCENVYGFLVMFVPIFIFLGASKILESMNTKEKCISYMMLPASNGEKFLSRVLYVTVGAALIFFVSLCLAELTRLVLTPLFNVSDTLRQFCLVDVFCETHGPYTYEPNLYATKVATNLWGYSIFILGGCFFRKNPFVKTVSICIGASIVLTFILKAFVADQMLIDQEWVMKMMEKYSWVDEGTINIIISTIFSALTILNWAISYRLFKKMQITERKLFKL